MGTVDALPVVGRSIGRLDLRDSLARRSHRLLPMALAEVHRCCRIDATVSLEISVDDPDDDEGTTGQGRDPEADPVSLLTMVARRAAFGVDHAEPSTDGSGMRLVLRARHELPDRVGPGMGLLLVGLNPSPAAATTGVGFAGPGNRFWPAALASGLATVDRDPDALLRRRRVGMTDLVARTTSRASELSAQEYRDGLAQLERLVRWLEPGVVCFVGLSGWRAAMDRRAVTGFQSSTLGGRPVYVMPNPSGLNANHRLEDFVEIFGELASALR